MNDGGGDLRAAVAAGVLGADADYRALLQSIVEVARAIFGARASSIFLLDTTTDELIFEAVAGEGASSLVGKRLPSGTGIAGWVLVTGQPLVLDDLEQDPRFARDVAESTGYVPKSLMAVPLLHGEEALGVLQVLDRPQRERFSLQEMELLGLFGNQAAIALDLLGRARRARSVVDDASPLGVVARLAATLDALPAERREPGLALLAALERVIGP
jgi:GAF domain-containing protein